MLFKLSLKNLTKSFKDYTIYFLTIVLGVAIFYMFNSLDSQEAMLTVSGNTTELIKLMIQFINWVSVFVAVVLGLLILYANKFLINRRKKEFGIYMLLGMKKSQISRIIITETVIIGIVSLFSGLVIGIFASQFMTMLVAKLFDADMTKYQFVFSQAALVKTCIYFAVMYLIIVVFNAFSISKYKLITLLTAVKRNEKVKIKNTALCVILFVIACTMLGYAYWKVTKGIFTLSSIEDTLKIVVIGAIATVIFFFSLSGFLLKIVQSRKSIYLKDTNMFVLRQLNNKINTTVIGMSVICIMLFLTITILSFSLSLNSSMKKSTESLTPVDLNLIMKANVPEEYVNMFGNVVKSSKYEVEASQKPIIEVLKQYEFDTSLLKDVFELKIYEYDSFTWGASLGKYVDVALEKFPAVDFDTKEEIIRLSDYNMLAKLYGKETLTLEDNQYVIIADFGNMESVRNAALSKGNNAIEINGKKYISKYDSCQNGFILIAAAHVNPGVIVVPDSCELTEDMLSERLLIANYNATNDEEKERIDALIVNPNGKFAKTLSNRGINMDGETKISIKVSSIGITTIVIFISIYLGIIFLIASSAILALKQLTESSDNKQRYDILRKIGCDEKLINKSLFWQIGIFFLLPLALAAIHSIFGIQFLLNLLGGVDRNAELASSILVSIGVIGSIYLAYLYATYAGSKEIIKG